MSVLARKRTLSQYQFYINAISLRKKIIFLLLRDFGIKSKVRNLGVKHKPMDEATLHRFADIAIKYDMPVQLAEYPGWLRDTAKGAIENALQMWTQENEETGQADSRRRNDIQIIQRTIQIMARGQEALQRIPDPSQYGHTL